MADYSSAGARPIKSCGSINIRQVAEIVHQELGPRSAQHVSLVEMEEIFLSAHQREGAQEPPVIASSKPRKRAWLRKTVKTIMGRFSSESSDGGCVRS